MESLKKYRILLAEDEEHLSEAIKLNLELEGYTVKAIENGKAVLATFENERFDLIILDVMLPEIDGFRICENIRLRNSKIPILFLTAKNSGSDKITGLKKGADDYLTKPFNLEELLLRVANLLRRSAQIPEKKDELNIFRFGKTQINFSSYEIIGINNEKHQLSKKELLLLKLLIDRKNEVVSRQTILENVWGYDVYPSTRTIDNFILNFRKYFEENPKNPRHFLSIRGIGYKFVL